MAELDSYAGTYHILLDNKTPVSVLRHGYQVWKHETKDIVIHVGKSLKWNISKKSDFDENISRTREIDFTTD